MIDYLTFYTKIKEGFEKRMLLQLKKPREIRQYQVVAKESHIYFDRNIHFEWMFETPSTNSFFSVGIHFEYLKKEKNEKIFTQIMKLKNDLEKSTGEKIIGETGWGMFRRRARIYIKKDFKNIDDESVQWGIEKMIIFVDIIKKDIIENLISA